MRGPIVLAISLLLAAFGSAHADTARRFTVQDSIGLSGFVAPGIQYYQTTPRVTASPDGSRFLAVTLRGDLASDRRIATFWVFDGREVRERLRRGGGAAVSPRALATWASGSTQDPVSRWRWSSDGRSVLFLGADDEGVRGLVRLDAATGAPTRLSPAGQDVTLFDERAGKAVFLAHPAQPESTFHMASANGLPEVVAATGQGLFPLLFPNEYAVAYEDAADTLWRVDGDGARRVGEGRPGGPVQLTRAKLVLSPDGAQVLTTTYVQRIPESWERYRARSDDAAFKYKADAPDAEPAINLYRPQQYAIVDLADGATQRLLDAPIELEAQFQDISAAWSPNGSRIAVVASFPPLTEGAGDGVRHCDLAVVEVASRAFDCLSAADPQRRRFSMRPVFSRLRWVGDDALEVATAAPRTPEQVSEALFRRGPQAWSRAARAAAAPALTLGVREGVDQRPVVTARLGGAAAQVIFDPNPQLAEVDLGSLVPYEWRDADGAPWSGALVRPPAYDPKRRYPLVLQTHNLDRGRFLVDGPSATGFAARAIAARDILVLQVDEPGKDAGTPKESASGAAGYRAAIRQLAAEGRVDPARVGIITWSHMGSYVMQGLVEEPTAYAAATFAEAADTSYPIYLLNIDYMGQAREVMSRAEVGPKPFGEGLKTWIAEANGFRLDRVCTPVLFQMNAPASLVYSWGAYAALRAQGKPVDMLYLRTGSHVLVKPRLRLIEQGQNVDWYDFWLNGRTDPAPEKAAQFARWERLRRGPRCGEPAAEARP